MTRKSNNEGMDNLCKNVSNQSVSNKTIIKLTQHHLISPTTAVIKTDSHPSQIILWWLNIDKSFHHTIDLQSRTLVSNISALILLGSQAISP